VRLYRALKSIYTEVSEIYLTAVLARPAYRDVHKLESEHLEGVRNSMFKVRVIRAFIWLLGACATPGCRRSCAILVLGLPGLVCQESCR